MKHIVKKLFDANNNVKGYITEGLNPELQINIYIEDEVAETIINEVAKMKEIPEIITDISNVTLKTIKRNDVIQILIPDINGKFPGDDKCDEMFAKQLI